MRCMTVPELKFLFIYSILYVCGAVHAYTRAMSILIQAKSWKNGFIWIGRYVYWCVAIEYRFLSCSLGLLIHMGVCHIVHFS